MNLQRASRRSEARSNCAANLGIASATWKKDPTISKGFYDSWGSRSVSLEDGSRHTFGVRRLKALWGRSPGSSFMPSRRII